MRMKTITDDAMETHFGLRLFDRATDYIYCHNYTGVNQAMELGTCSVGKVIRARLSKSHPWSG